MLNIFKLIDRAIERFSSYALVVSVLTMLVLAVVIIILRWFSITFHWIEPFIRHLVFLCAFLGGALATGRRTHIGIDIVGKFLEAKKNWQALLWVQRIVSFSCSIICFYLIKAGLDFVAIEAKYGKEVFLGLHSKVLVSIIPFGFFLIGYRFFYLFISSFSKDFVVNPEELKEGAA